MKKRKHRVVVEITAEEPITQKEARLLVHRGLDGTSSDTFLHAVTCWDTKEYNRVKLAEDKKAKGN